MRLALLAAAILLAGCVSPPTKDDPALAVDAAGAPSTPSPAAPEPGATGVGAEPTAEEPRAPRVVVVEDTATITFAVGAPCVMQVRPCSRGPMQPGALDVPEAGATRATLVVTWDAAASASGIARVEVRPQEGEAIAEGEGESPLTFDLPPGLPAGTLSVFVEPAEGNVIVRGEAALVLTLTYPPGGGPSPNVPG